MTRSCARRYAPAGAASFRAGDAPPRVRAAARVRRRAAARAAAAAPGSPAAATDDYYGVPPPGAPLSPTPSAAAHRAHSPPGDGGVFLRTGGGGDGGTHMRTGGGGDGGGHSRRAGSAGRWRPRSAAHGEDGPWDAYSDARGVSPRGDEMHLSGVALTAAARDRSRSRSPSPSPLAHAYAGGGADEAGGGGAASLEVYS